MCFLGEGGTIAVDRFRYAIDLRVQRRFGYGVRTVRLAPRVENIGWRLRRLASPSYDPSYVRALAAFVAEVRGGPATTARLADGAASLDVVLTAEESARSATPVTVAGGPDANPPRH
jgi:hypothetical protein